MQGLSTYTHTHMCIYTQICIHKHIHIHICIYVNTHIFVTYLSASHRSLLLHSHRHSMNTYTHTCVYMYTYIYTHIYTYIYIHIYYIFQPFTSNTVAAFSSTFSALIQQRKTNTKCPTLHVSTSSNPLCVWCRRSCGNLTRISYRSFSLSPFVRIHMYISPTLHVSTSSGSLCVWCRRSCGSSTRIFCKSVSLLFSLYIHSYISACMCCTHTRTRTHTWICIYIYIHTCTCTSDMYAHIYVYTHIHIHVHICMHIHVHICVHVYMYIYMYIYTYICTCKSDMCAYGLASPAVVLYVYGAVVRAAQQRICCSSFCVSFSLCIHTRVYSWISRDFLGSFVCVCVCVCVRYCRSCGSSTSIWGGYGQ